MGRTARLLNLALGLWLIASAFLWPHTAPQSSMALVAGALCTFSAAVGLVRPPLRYMNTVVSIVLFISAFTLPRMGSATFWNDALVAMAMFALSLVPPAPRFAPV
jgi:hypothetical protein